MMVILSIYGYSFLKVVEHFVRSPRKQLKPRLFQILIKCIIWRKVCTISGRKKMYRDVSHIICYYKTHLVKIIIINSCYLLTCFVNFRQIRFWNVFMLYRKNNLIFDYIYAIYYSVFHTLVCARMFSFIIHNLSLESCWLWSIHFVNN